MKNKGTTAMTDDELTKEADRFLGVVKDLDDDDHVFAELFASLHSVAEKAYQEGAKTQFAGDKDHYDAAIAQARAAGYEEAREDARKIASKHSFDDKCLWHCSLYIEERVIAMNPDGEGK